MAQLHIGVMSASVGWLMLCRVHKSVMKIWFYCLVFAVPSLAVSSQTCPSDHFSAIFAATVDHTLAEDDLYGIYHDPELYFFTPVLNFRDRDIGHVAEDAFYFFNKTYCLDFHTSTPNVVSQAVFFRVARMCVKYCVSTSTWR